MGESAKSIEIANPSKGTTITAQMSLPSKYKDFENLFNKEAANVLPEHKPYDHSIPLQEASMPPFGPIYSLSEIELKVLKEYITTNLKNGFITPSTSPAGAPILFQKKKDGSHRLCVDYRGLNSITVKNRYALPLISELMDRVRGAKIFTKLDLRGAYNLLRVRESDQWKTAFRCRYGHFEYRVMPFGLANAPASFQALINDVLRKHLDDFVIAFLDDILIFSKNVSEHPNHVRQILQALSDANLFVKLEKCIFDAESVEFLGHIISSMGISMVKDRTNAILSWPLPKSQTELLSFLGFCNWYRKFIDHYSMITTEFNYLLKKDNPYVWTPKHEVAFKLLKEAFRSDQVLHLFNQEKKAILETDASGTAICGILSQWKGEELVPICFFSRSLNAAEQNYTIGEKELLAIKDSLVHWRCYLLGARHTITVLSDHANLIPFTISKPLTGRIGRWALTLADYDYQIVHVPGKTNSRADGLSRRADYIKTLPEPTPVIKPEQLIVAASTCEDVPHRVDMLTPTMLPPTSFERQLRAAYLKDPFAAKTIKALKDKTNNLPDNLQHFRYSDQGLLLLNDLVYLPRDTEVQQEVLKLYHDNPMAGHFGADKTFLAVSKDYYHPRLRGIVNEYVSQCLACSRNKASTHKPHGRLEPLPIPTRPWESVSMDFITKLPISRSKATQTSVSDSILVVVDRFTKLAHFIPVLETVTSEQLATILFANVFKLHGLPSSIITDRGSTFMSNFFRCVSQNLGIEHSPSTAYHPQTDGQTERTNAILEQILRNYVNYEQDNWVDLLPLAEFAYNNSTSTTTKESPFFSNYGFSPRFNAMHSSTASDAANIYTSELQTIWQYLRTNIIRAQDNQAHAHNRSRTRLQPFGVGDLVMINRKNFTTSRPSAKLDHKNLGPFRVLQQHGNSAFTLQLPSTWRVHPTFHISLLEKAPDHATTTNSGPEPFIVNNEPEYEVEVILDHKMVRGTSKYLVKWKGYSSEENSWLREEDLVNADKLLRDYLTKNGKNREGKVVSY